MAFEYLQGGGLHNVSGQLVPVLSHLHSKLFPDIEKEPHVFQFQFSLPLVPLLNITKLLYINQWEPSENLLQLRTPLDNL